MSRDEDMQSVTSLMSMSRAADIANVAELADDYLTTQTLSESAASDIRQITYKITEFGTNLTANNESK